MRKPRKRRAKKAGQQHQAEASLDGTAAFIIEDKGIAIIRPAKTRHGPRRRLRKLEFAQLAIQALYGVHPPRNINGSRLARDVNDWLRKDPSYRATGLGRISRLTILRALKTVAP
jgi:hypothetical protein